MKRFTHALLTITILSGIVLSSSITSAETEVIDTVELTVPIACTMGGTGQTSHNASINPGTYSGASGNEYEAGIGKTTLTTFCNDNNGFSIYAIGFTNDLYEGEPHTKLVGQNTNQTIATKVYANGDIDSNWSMRVTKVDNPVSGDPVTYNPDNMSIQNSFNSWHIVPDAYTKVAQYNSSTTDPATTDTTLGAKIETTYATYISSTQAADTYTGQVKYTMVHPYNHTEPEPPSFKVLYTGRALSNTPGQENPATVRMYNLPEDGKYNLLGTDDGLYDKLTPNKLYGGYYKYYGDFDDFEGFLDNYEVYDGKNMLMRDYGAAQAQDGSALSPTEGSIYLVKEVPTDYLTHHLVYGKSGGKLVSQFFFTVLDDWYYAETGFSITNRSNNETLSRAGIIYKSYSIKFGDGTEYISASTVNNTASDSNDYVSVWKDANKAYLVENGIIDIVQYWITGDQYKVTGTDKWTVEYNDLYESNL